MAKYLKFAPAPNIYKHVKKHIGMVVVVVMALVVVVYVWGVCGGMWVWGVGGHGGMCEGMPW